MWHIHPTEKWLDKVVIKMNEKQLTEKLIELRKDMIKQNAQVATGTTPKSPGQIRNMKKTVARIMTLLREKRGT
ncbi:MAG: 50S ribosomal protein L29, partial [Bacteroidetes bacterium]|nr:50S ribosomal protein L29 [Bacteroidota bacterium]